MVSERFPLSLHSASSPPPAPPPCLTTPLFRLQADLRKAIPAACWEKNAFKSFAHLALDLGIVVGLGAAAVAVNAW